MSRVFCLDFHAPYRCRHAAVCCTSGWAIPVEAPLHARLSGEIDAGRLAVPGGGAPAEVLVRRDDLPDGMPAVLGLDAAGRCRFHDGTPGGGCAIHRQRGQDWLPSSCRHFPRVILIDARGAFVTLSHYCPTAARLLFTFSGDADIVEAPAAIAGIGPLEGLDARDALPPLLHPAAIMDLESFGLWERHMVRVLGAGGETPRAALARVTRDAEAVRAWDGSDGLLVDHVRAVVARSRPEPDATRSEGWAERFRAPVGRYLAAKAFASWVAYQGRGVRTIVRSIAAALGEVEHAAARLEAKTRRPLDETQLVEAIRAADLQLVHRAERQALADRWSAVEVAPSPTYPSSTQGPAPAGP